MRLRSNENHLVYLEVEIQWHGCEPGQKILKELENENRKLKQMYVDLALDNRILEEVIEKTLEPEIKKHIAVEIVEEYELYMPFYVSLAKINANSFAQKSFITV